MSSILLMIDTKLLCVLLVVVVVVDLHQCDHDHDHHQEAVVYYYYCIPLEGIHSQYMKVEFQL